MKKLFNAIRLWSFRRNCEKNFFEVECEIMLEVSLLRKAGAL